MYWNHNVIDEDQGININDYFDICGYEDRVNDVYEELRLGCKFDQHKIRENETFKEKVLRAYVTFYDFQTENFDKIKEGTSWV